jgi:hypothetical protein
MGIFLSKKDANADKQSSSQKVNFESANSDMTTLSPRRMQATFYHCHVYTHQHCLPLRGEEEEKCDSIESDLKTLSHMIGAMVKDQGHRLSRAAVRPLDDSQRKHSLIVDSLPPPAHDVRKVHRGSSLPVRCPGLSEAHEENDDAEYLSKLYAYKTWDMYKRINESRKKRQVRYQPAIREKSCFDQFLLAEEEEDDEASSSFESSMIFAFDFK